MWYHVAESQSKTHFTKLQATAWFKVHDAQQGLQRSGENENEWPPQKEQVTAWLKVSDAHAENWGKSKWMHPQPTHPHTHNK